jgi:hypothetical protein
VVLCVYSCVVGSCRFLQNIFLSETSSIPSILATKVFPFAVPYTSTASRYEMVASASAYVISVSGLLQPMGNVSSWKKVEM